MEEAFDMEESWDIAAAGSRALRNADVITTCPQKVVTPIRRAAPIACGQYNHFKSKIKGQNCAKARGRLIGFWALHCDNAAMAEPYQAFRGVLEKCFNYEIIAFHIFAAC